MGKQNPELEKFAELLEKGTMALFLERNAEIKFKTPVKNRVKIIEYDGKIIILHRHNNKSQGGKWGLPAGKVEVGESLNKAMVREIKEETGLSIPENKLIYFKKTFHRHGDYDFIFHTFSIKFDSLPTIVINPHEHSEFVWKTPREVLEIRKTELVEDLDDVLKIFYKI